LYEKRCFIDLTDKNLIVIPCAVKKKTGYSKSPIPEKRGAFINGMLSGLRQMDTIHYIENLEAR